jgi:transcriptional regulator with XRE-family HTH domain
MGSIEVWHVTIPKERQVDEMTRRQNVSRWLEPLWPELGATDDERARRLGVSRETVQAYKHARSEPPARTMRKIARLTGFDPDVGEIVLGQIPRRWMRRAQARPGVILNALEEARW